MSLKKQIDQSDELYEILRNNCVDGLPTMNTSMFSQMTEKSGKDVFRRTLANYIEKEKPPFPVKIFNKEIIFSLSETETKAFLIFKFIFKFFS